MGNDEELEALGAKLREPRTPKDSLVKLLKTLSSLLANVDQSAPNTTHSAMNPCKEALVRTELLRHKDKEVRLLVATCASEIMRIEAPDIPYDDEVLKELFTLIVNTFKGLDDMESPSFSKRISILETVASIKSCVLMLDLDVGDLVHDMFKIFFLKARDDHPPSVLKTMSEIMTLVIDESDEPDGTSTRTSGGIRDLLEEILQHLVPGKRTSAAAQKLAAEVISRTCKTQDQLVPYVRSLLSLVFEKNAPPWAEDSYSELVFKLYQLNPDILMELSNDLFQLLKSEEAKIRLTAVNLLGKIFSHPVQAQNAFENCAPLVNELGKRCADMNMDVRLAAIEAVRSVVLANLSLPDNKDLLGGLDLRLLDLDPQVRIKAVSAICDIIQADPRPPPMNIVDDVALRLRDKRPIVRTAALQKLSKVYQAYCGRGSPSFTEIHQLECIPGKIVRCFQEFKPQGIELVFAESLFPAELSMEDRVRHWIIVLSTLDSTGKHYLERVLDLKDRFQREMRSYLTVSQKLKEEENPDLEKKMQIHVKSMSITFVDAPKFEDEIHKLHTAKDNNIQKAILTLLNVKTSHAEARTASDDLLKLVGKNSQESFKTLATRCSYLMFGREHVQAVFKVIHELKAAGLKDMVSAALSLLVLFAGPFPSLMEGVEDEILALIKDGEEDHVKELGVLILAKAGHCLRDNLADQKSDILLTLEKLSLEGTRNQAKHAVPAIASLSTDSGIKALSVLYGRLVDTLQSPGRLGTVMQSLGCIAQIAMPVFETRESDMVKFILEDLFRREQPQEMIDEAKADWSFRSEESVIKIYGLKTLVKSCLPNRDAHLRKKERVKEMFPILLKLLQSGTISDEVKSSEADKAYIRLAAAKAVLRLARTWDKEIPPDVFHYTVMIALDPFLEVRQNFMTKTSQYLKSRHLPTKYATVFALAAADATKEMKDDAKRYIMEFVDRERFRQQPNDGLQHWPEYVLTYLLHVLGHHPSFPEASTEDPAAYESLFRQLHLFMQALVDSESKKEDGGLPAVLQILATIKKTQDAVDPAKSRNIYVLCDIGIQIAKKLAKKAIDVPAQSVTVPLPTAFFKAAGDAKESTENHLPACLTDEVITKFHDTFSVKPLVPPRGQKRGKKESDSSDEEDEEDHPPAKKARGEAGDKKASTEKKTPARGRAAKKEKPKQESDEEEEVQPKPRKRGRFTKVEKTETEETPPAPKRRGGRPSKASQKKAKAEDESPATSVDAKPEKAEKPETRTKQQPRRKSTTRPPPESEPEKSDEEAEESTPPPKKKAQEKDKATASKNGTEEGEALIGRKIAVWWPIDKKYYKGTIVGYNAKNDMHKVHYVDGDKEVLKMSAEKYHFTDEARRGTTPSKEPASKTKKKTAGKEEEPQGSSQKMKSSPRGKKRNRDSDDGQHQSETKVNGSYKRGAAEAEAESSQPAASVDASKAAAAEAEAESGSEEETLESYRRRKRKAARAAT